MDHGFTFSYPVVIRADSDQSVSLKRKDSEVSKKAPSKPLLKRNARK
jgi:hexokinase